MKLKTSYLYQFIQLKNTVLGFYAIFIAIIMALFCIIPLSITSSTGNGSAHLTGMEAITSIFIAIVMLEVFKEHLLMLIQNGISRKSYFIGRFLTIGSLSLLISILDSLFFSILRMVASTWIDNLICYSLYESIYPTKISPTVTFMNMIERTGFHFFVYLMVMSCAFLISLIYYRLNKAFRVVFCAGIPIFLFILFPLIDYNIFQGKLSNEISDFMNFIFGITANQPLRGTLALTIFSILSGILAWILLRKISIKE